MRDHAHTLSDFRVPILSIDRLGTRRV